jgi:osmotically inducible protein OsmC
VLSNTQYSFRTRFDEGIGTNPDELIAAALGGCFSMALSNELGDAGHPSEGRSEIHQVKRIDAFEVS